MIIIGHKFSEIKNIYTIDSISDVKNTPNNSIVHLKYDENMIEYLQQNNINFAISATNKQEAILSNLAGAKFIIINILPLAKEIQTIANEYLFDSRILLKISHIKEINTLYPIDGAILSSSIK
ncbi:MAG: Unknown protein [uncultured Campylobacterales bacterium]|uniref:Uncharacterized protein n=1 Tax=uncultured Campylobacterales bacterium TaxID=352960 RepID=A0A6S6S1U3_9BACT|nr:MAG: Unknown protein [uncultured Campylobacterales bacterium]